MTTVSGARVESAPDGAQASSAGAGVDSVTRAAGWQKVVPRPSARALPQRRGRRGGKRAGSEGSDQG